MVNQPLYPPDYSPGGMNKYQIKIRFITSETEFDQLSAQFGWGYEMRCIVKDGIYSKAFEQLNMQTVKNCLNVKIERFGLDCAYVWCVDAVAKELIKLVYSHCGDKFIEAIVLIDSNCEARMYS